MSLQAAIKKRFSGFSLDVSLNTNGGVMGILGASGSGKSMTLKCIAGIETPMRGGLSSTARYCLIRRKKSICRRRSGKLVIYSKIMHCFRI